MSLKDEQSLGDDSGYRHEDYFDTAADTENPNNVLPDHRHHAESQHSSSSDPHDSTKNSAHQIAVSKNPSSDSTPMLLKEGAVAAPDITPEVNLPNENPNMDVYGDATLKQQQRSPNLSDEDSGENVTIPPDAASLSPVELLPSRDYESFESPSSLYHHHTTPQPLPPTADGKPHHFTATGQNQNRTAAATMGAEGTVGNDIEFYQSPTHDMWPQRSPIHPNDGRHDGNQYSFFAQSFDTLTDQDFHDLKATPSCVSPHAASRLLPRIDTRSHSSSPPPPPHTFEHSAPPLGDISPIKFDTRNMVGIATSPSDLGSPNQRRAIHRNPIMETPQRPYTPHLPRTSRQEYPYPVERPFYNQAPWQQPGIQHNIHMHGYPPGPHDQWGYTAPNYHHTEHANPYPPNPPQRPNPFFVLRTLREVFGAFSYLLPCVREANVCPVNLGPYSSIQHYQEPRPTIHPEDLKIAQRRIETAVHAFGGYTKNNTRDPEPPAASRGTTTSSIFRLNRSRDAVTEQDNRYRVGTYCVSWDVEEARATPVESRQRIKPPPSGSKDSPHFIDNVASPQSRATISSKDTASTPSSDADSAHKMKYRCKLCGQWKQNHNCPYQRSIQRSIGTMVNPVVNAHTACEPGHLTPALSKMNNFVSYDSDQDILEIEDRTPFVTPDGSKERGLPKSDPWSPSAMAPASTLPPPGSSRDSFLTHQSSGFSQNSVDLTALPNSAHPNESYRKRSYSQYVAATSSEGHHEQMHRQSHPAQGYGHHPRGPFLPSLKLRPEHFRAVSRPPKRSNRVSQSSGSDHGSYQYPPVELSFTERKRLSDTLFALCQEIPTLTREAAGLLRHGRAQHEWDLCVAQCLTQVVISMYCHDTDHQLYGLQQYLLHIGLSC